MLGISYLQLLTKLHWLLLVIHLYNPHNAHSCMHLFYATHWEVDMFCLARPVNWEYCNWSNPLSFLAPCFRSPMGSGHTCSISLLTPPLASPLKPMGSNPQLPTGFLFQGFRCQCAVVLKRGNHQSIITQVRRKNDHTRTSIYSIFSLLHKTGDPASLHYAENDAVACLPL